MEGIYERANSQWSAQISLHGGQSFERERKGARKCFSYTIKTDLLFPTTLRFLTQFFRSYLCLIGPFKYISLYESLLQP